MTMTVVRMQELSGYGTFLCDIISGKDRRQDHSKLFASIFDDRVNNCSHNLFTFKTTIFRTMEKLGLLNWKILTCLTICPRSLMWIIFFQITYTVSVICKDLVL